ncbi:DUF692 domain-containing protein [Photobacterium sanctipauli]|uniref:DUF692 domain-containing protein n=1 Tax=Photobacterium sanctipauli TaxID=1342794 RepID=A0A2T3NPI3_9GAMM|nr:DUF692 domain-containing protein [Photobacterium sanctipauli]PSW18185.1 DUF692 domain-containing protein [Photobacterium sanctipauli]
MRTITLLSKGIGLRNEHMDVLCQQPNFDDIDFLELAPENWMNIGGAKQEALECISEKYPLVAHGLSLSIGDTQPLNISFIKQVGSFLDRYNIEIYSEHLSFSRDNNGYLYDLLPIPRHKENLAYLSDRIKAVQDILQRPLVLENISYYYNYPGDIPEEEFFTRLVEMTQCELLLDINNVFVNANNHHYDALTMIKGMPSDAIRYFHIAGHLKQDDNSLLDTHGKAVTNDVIQLAKDVIDFHGPRPLLLERDHFVPSIEELTQELNDVYHFAMECNLQSNEAERYALSAREYASSNARLC